MSLNDRDEEEQSRIEEAESNYRQRVAETTSERLIDVRELEKARNDLDDKIDEILNNE